MIKHYHFSRSEFSCKCGCGFAAVDVELLDVLEQVRTYFTFPVTINSACRCENHNKSVGGADESHHKRGMAADITVRGVPPLEVYRYLDSVYSRELGLGEYDTFTHVDVRKEKARW